MRIVAALLAITLAFGGCEGSCNPESSDAIPNVRLGMSPRDVRERFQPAAGAETGSWQTALGTADDTALEWTARDPSSKITRARFEFHLGMLVAIRATTKDSVPSETVSTTAKTVTVRAPAFEGGTAITVLARDCPAHHDEAETFAARAPK